ncbi:serine/threonine-protein kinase, partial [Zoogloea sp.]|uniref:serine/threonine protein kinase n=1 Tax=Zoogloea sp. TaxID=49181 RepID=UPI0014159636
MSNVPEEDDRTILSTASDGPPPAAAQAADDDEDGHALPAGTLIGEFELRAKVGEGGFSIVYLAWDHSLERKVALKEYMPGSIASRRGPTTVAPRSERHRSTYEAGLKSFVNEAKLLAQFDHPSLVKVYRFWEANGTAYMVMPLYEGETLKDSIQADRTQVSEAWLTDILTPLCDALRLIHGEQCYHRDIAPDNIILLEGSGRPLLLDFGAARRVIGDMTQALTVILKPGYAPVEQYAELPDMKQGPWTDVYALAATVHWAITGSTPPPSVGRLLNDQYRPLAERAPAGFSPAFLGALDRALAARPEQRTQTIADFGHDLGLSFPQTADKTRVHEAAVSSTASATRTPPAASPPRAPTRPAATASPPASA